MLGYSSQIKTDTSSNDNHDNIISPYKCDEEDLKIVIALYNETG